MFLYCQDLVWADVEDIEEVAEMSARYLYRNRKKPGVPLNDGSGGGVGNVGRGGCANPKGTRKGRNPKRKA